MIPSESGPLPAQKQRLRLAIRQKRAALSVSERHSRSKRACDRLLLAPFAKRAWIWGGYRAFGSEADPAAAMDVLHGRGHVVVWPRISDTQPRLRFLRSDDASGFERGAFGIDEPCPDHAQVSAGALQIMVAPGVAFDLRGGRLGQGGGYYDELIQWLDRNGARRFVVVVGFAFECQLVSSIPRSLADGVMDFVVTERRVIDCVARRQTHQVVL